MLVHLTIRDFAIISHLELELDAGMTVMTGETGAGKSILIDALSLALGGRASRSALRNGCERAEVVAAFQIEPNGDVDERLRALELGSSDGECILRRVLLADGRSRAYVNGSHVPMQVQREIGDRLVDIHGQNAHQSLIRRDVQRELLDLFAGHEDRLQELAGICARWGAAVRELEKRQAVEGDRDSRLEFLRFLVRELADLDLRPHELEELETEQRRLGHAADLRDACRDLLHRIGSGEDDSAGDALERAVSRLEELGRLEPRLEPIHELLASAAVEVREATISLRTYADSVDIDPERLHEVEARLTEIHDLARKHRIGPEELPARLEQQRREMAELESNDARIEALIGERDRLLAEFEACAQALHDRREKAARRLAREITANMKRLGMADGELRIEVAAKRDRPPSRRGWDDVEFLVRTNPGQPPLPLSKVASGGELSRISLGIEVATAARAGLPCLVFDEVDVGIGGRVAEIVGRELSLLGRSRQVLCVTHLPQVASRADHHLRIDKQIGGGRIEAALSPVTGEARVGEIARMLGGMEITTQTVAHAREMLGSGGR